MTASNVSSEIPLGFLTVVEDQSHGLFGGYLVLNRAGRPLEFHCTTPVRPNRAQEILYGPTLRPFLYGEQIGRTLLEKGKHAPGLVLTDCEPMLAVEEFVESPVALVGGRNGNGTIADDSRPGKRNGQKWRIDGEHQGTPDLHFFEAGGQRLGIAEGAGSHQETLIVDILTGIAATLDISEPFDRIRAAIGEARRGGQ